MISYLTKNVKMPSKSTLTSVEPYIIYIILTGELGRQAGMFLAWFK